MKLLLFSDLHCSTRAAVNLVRQAQSVDIVIGAGDFANMRQGINLCIDVLKEIDRPTVLVPGNSESLVELTEACHSWLNAHVLHGSGTIIKGVKFYGLGGGIPTTPFGSWSVDFTENQARELLAECPKRCILVSHSPPKGIVDVSSSGHSLGSIAVAEVIDKKNPQLVVCGHIHESAGQQKTVGTTTIINAGPQGIVLELDETHIESNQN